jgi:hypothetical protein
MWHHLGRQGTAQGLSLPPVPFCALLDSSQGSHYYSDTSTGYYASLGLQGAIGVFSRSFAYQDLLSALAFRDMISTDHGVHLPLLAYSVTTISSILLSLTSPSPHFSFRIRHRTMSSLD